MKKESKRYKNLVESLKKKDLKNLDQIIKEVKNGSGVKFVESVDLSLKINIKLLLINNTDKNGILIKTVLQNEF